VRGGEKEGTGKGGDLNKGPLSLPSPSFVTLAGVAVVGGSGSRESGDDEASASSSRSLASRRE
jgi:hypothetical protein